MLHNLTPTNSTFCKSEDKFLHFLSKRIKVLTRESIIPNPQLFQITIDLI